MVDIFSESLSIDKLSLNPTVACSTTKQENNNNNNNNTNNTTTSKQHELNTTTRNNRFQYANVESIAANASIPKMMRAMAADSSENEPFYVIDLGQVARKYDQWVAAMPRVDPFYAVKCNGDPNILRVLVNMGTGFDCASKAEMDLILSMGVPADRIIYAHPCKMASHIRFASEHGVRKMTFDNENELHKMKELFPNARLVLRVLTDNSRSICNLGLKFGASLARVPNLLRLAKELELDVAGVSFHVGSGCFDATAFADAVAVAKSVFEIGKEIGFDFDFLDLGGGFPGSDSGAVRFDDIAPILNSALEKHFPVEAYKNLQIIAEPGRYFVSLSHTLAVNVIAKRSIVPGSSASTSDLGACAAAAAALASAEHAGISEPTFMYYVNDGVYGSFNCIMFDHAVVQPKILVSGNLGVVAMDSDSESDSEGDVNSGYFSCSMWGPTCDSMDCITKTARLPELAIGDWLYFEDMGAYTVAASSTFNGFPKPLMHYVNSEAHRGIF